LALKLSKNRIMHRVVFAIIALFSVGVLVAQPITVKQLTCENRVNPMGIDVAAPVFGWQIVTEKRNVKQSAYQLQVSTDSLFSQANATIWNSGQKKKRTVL
jgi:alpha-L-rhamnosidase